MSDSKDDPSKFQLAPFLRKAAKTEVRRINRLIRFARNHLGRDDSDTLRTHLRGARLALMWMLKYEDTVPPSFTVATDVWDQTGMIEFDDWIKTELGLPPEN